MESEWPVPDICSATDGSPGAVSMSDAMYLQAISELSAVVAAVDPLILRRGAVARVNRMVDQIAFRAGLVE